MAKVSSMERNLKRKKLNSKYREKRASLKQVIMDKDLSVEERFSAQLKLASLPRNSARVRYRNRCNLTGRPRGYYKKFRLSRICLRELASIGQIPGMIKSSW